MEDQNAQKAQKIAQQLVNDIYEIKIIDEDNIGNGIAKIDNFTIFIPGAIKGETVKILIVKVLSKKQK